MATGTSAQGDPRALVIVAHPDLHGRSRVNRRWAEELAAHPDEFVVHDLFAALPAGSESGLAPDDVAREQELLAAHDLVVFQFPVFWYSCPPLLRAWMDAVYSLGWAYGGDRALPGEPGRMVAGKHFACAVSAGDVEEHYRPGEAVGFSMDEVLAPFWATANYLEASYEPHAFTIFGTEGDLSDAQIDESAAAYVAWLRELRAARSRRP